MMSEEKVYEVFGKKYYCKDYVELKFKDVKRRNLKRLFKIFKELLPDHPDEENTWLVFLDKGYNLYDVLFVCSHFEHDNYEDLPRIATVMDMLAYELVVSSEQTHLELLDGIWEKLIICIYGVHEDTVRSILKGRKRKRKTIMIPSLMAEVKEGEADE